MSNIENHLEELCNWVLQKIYAAPNYQEALAITDVFEQEIKYVDLYDLNPTLLILLEHVEDKLHDIVGYYENS